MFVDLRARALTCAEQLPSFTCPVGSYCADGVTPSACPAGTTSVAGSSKPTDCYSLAGVLEFAAKQQRLRACTNLLEHRETKSGRASAHVLDLSLGYVPDRCDHDTARCNTGVSRSRSVNALLSVFSCPKQSQQVPVCWGFGVRLFKFEQKILHLNILHQVDAFCIKLM